MVGFKRNLWFAVVVGIAGALWVGSTCAATSETLLSRLHGYAAGTTGGLGGAICTVTSTADYASGESPIAGSLRKCIEGAKGKVWVGFDPVVFAPAKNSEIILKRSLRFQQDNVTVEGSGAKVTLTYIMDWNNYIPVQITGRTDYYCKRKAGVEPGAFFQILNRQNIIISHIIFNRREIHTELIAGMDMYDKECFGDVITLANQSQDHGFDRIWINQNEFSECGDGCIDVTRPTPSAARVTISGDKFTGSNKVMLLGSDVNSLGQPVTTEARTIRVSVYGNRFIGTHQRQPKVNYAIAFVSSNSYEGWVRYCIYAGLGSRVVADHNVFAPSAGQLQGGIQSPSEQESGIKKSATLAWQNIWKNNAVPFKERAPTSLSWAPTDPAPLIDPSTAGWRFEEFARW
jgi:pectate lyase